ncbi:MAG: hypothetical protein LBG44_10975 [Gemmatimonadota bacterium]|jgi:hypothetical protein|nr:hypothetical protein [Gemmatimonadota bacterium]
MMIIAALSRQRPEENRKPFPPVYPAGSVVQLYENIYGFIGSTGTGCPVSTDRDENHRVHEPPTGIGEAFERDFRHDTTSVRDIKGFPVTLTAIKSEN